MLKENWIIRVIITFLIVNMALGGWARQNNVSLDTYIPIALVWYVIFYFCTGFFLRFKKPKDKPTLSKVYKSPVQSPTPIEMFEPLKKITPNEIKEDIIETDYKTKIEDNTMNDESYEITEQEQQDLFNQVKITPEEEEQIYADVSKETEPDKRKEGIWAKALIQSDGDEQKTKIAYMKLRVETLINELKNVKFNELIKELEKEKDKLKDLEQKVKTIFIEMVERQKYEREETSNPRVIFHSVCPIITKLDGSVLNSFTESFSIKSKSGFDRFIEGENLINIRIFKQKDKRYDSFYWMKDSKNKSNWETPEDVKKAIQRHFADFTKSIKLLREYKFKK